MTRPRTIVLLLAAIIVGAIAVGCVPTGERPELVDEYLDDAASGPPIECLPPGDLFAGFEVQAVSVRTADGGVNQCVLVADTPELRQRGLSGVPDLGGHIGMIFAFPEDTTGSFWMGNTHVPLTIAFIDSTGGVVAILDMEPCPDAGADCPSYFPDTPYRWALEVPVGQLTMFGLVDGAVFDTATLPVAAG